MVGGKGERAAKAHRIVSYRRKGKGPLRWSGSGICDDRTTGKKGSKRL